jgi:two-component system, response regulator PdtaR
LAVGATVALGCSSSVACLIPAVAGDHPQDLRVLVADERQIYIERIARALTELGHQVIATEVETAGVSKAMSEHEPDAAIVALHDDTEHALELIAEVAHGTVCPVMALVEGANPEFIAEAAERGIFAHLNSADHDELMGAIDVAFRRFEEYRRLQQAFGRRARIERAKGVLIERYSIDDQEAFERLRTEARASRRGLIEVVDEVLGDKPS